MSEVLSDNVEKIEELVTAINLANQSYLFTDNPLVDDPTYDEMVSELAELENESPDLIHPNSPFLKLKRREGDPHAFVEHDPKFRLPKSTFIAPETGCIADELNRFIKEAQENYESSTDDSTLSTYPYPCIRLEHLYTGIPISLVYEYGFLRRAISIGDGTVGLDVTHIVKSIINVPVKLNEFETEPHPDRLVIRGIITMPKKVHDRFILDRIEAGHYKNKISKCITEIVYSRDNELVIRYPLSLLALNIADIDPDSTLDEFKTHSNRIEYLEMLGFNVPESKQVSVPLTILEHADAVRKHQAKYPYPLEGIIVNVEDSSLKHMMKSCTDKECIDELYCYFRSVRAVMQLHKVIWDIDENDKLTATLHLIDDITQNHAVKARLTDFNEFTRHDLREGDLIEVILDGDQVKEITSIVQVRNPNKQPVRLRSDCPTCNTPLVNLKGDHVHQCNNVRCTRKLENIHRRYMAINDIERKALSNEVYNYMNNIRPIDYHPLQLFNSEFVTELMEQYTALISGIDIWKDTDPAVLASQYMVSVVPHPTLGLYPLLSTYNIIDVSQAVFANKKLTTLEDLKTLKDTDIYSITHLSAKEAEEFIKFLGYPEIYDAICNANIDHPLVVKQDQ